MTHFGPISHSGKDYHPVYLEIHPRGFQRKTTLDGAEVHAMKIDGRCHCGYVSFEAEADPETTTIYNCTDCQTMSGAPLRAIIITKPGTFVLLSGEPTEYRKTADSGSVRPQGFCPRCGTALYSTAVGDEPKAYAVRVGALRQRNELVPRRQGFVRSQQSWVNEINSLPQFDGMPPR
jgi:hypothetical protein